MEAELSTAEALDEKVPGDLLATSKGKPWRDLLVQVFARNPVQEGLIIPAVPEPLVVWVISGAACVEERELEGEWMANDVRAGDFFLTHSPRPCELRWRSLSREPFQVLHIYLGLPLMRRAQADLQMADSGAAPQLREVSGGADPVLSTLLEQMRGELMQRRQPSAMFVQGLAQSLALHLLRSYASAAGDRSEYRGGLPAFKLHRVLTLLQSRLHLDFELARLAKEAQLSESHFCRAFKQSTGFTPSRYFIRLRMDRARRLLRESEMSVIEVGLEVGYSSPSHFAQVFRRVVGVTPSDYRGTR